LRAVCIVKSEKHYLEQLKCLRGQKRFVQSSRHTCAVSQQRSWWWQFCFDCN